MIARLALVTAAALAMVAPRAADAHESPPSHHVVVQAEAGSIAVLVTYEPPRSKNGDPGLSALALGQGKGARSGVLKTALARRALAPVAITIDGAPARWANVQTKVVRNRRGPGFTAYVLATVKVAPGQAVRAELVRGNGTRSRTRLSWLDRSGGVAQANAPPARWLKAGTPISLRFDSPTK